MKATLVLDFLRILFSWPVLVLFLVLFFRREIRRLLDRVSRVKAGDKEIDFSPTEQKVPNAELPEEVFGEENVLSEHELRRMIASAENVAELSRDNTELKKALTFERLYQQIFGNQLMFLQRLRKAGDAGLSYREVSDWYLELMTYRKKMPFEKWLSFLQEAKLVSRSTPTGEENSMLHLTDSGSDFLEYLSWSGYEK